MPNPSHDVRGQRLQANWNVKIGKWKWDWEPPGVSVNFIDVTLFVVPMDVCCYEPCSDKYLSGFCVTPEVHKKMLLKSERKIRPFYGMKGFLPDKY
jgi:hypothetical protein